MKKIWCWDELEKYNVFRKIDENHTFKKHFINKMYSAPMGFMIDDDGNITQTKSHKIFKMNKGDNIPPMDYFCGAKIGDMVEVTDLMEVFNNCSDWWALDGYRHLYKVHESAKLNHKYKLIKVEKSLNYPWSTTLLALIQDTETEQVYIVGQIGIRKVD